LWRAPSFKNIFLCAVICTDPCFGPAKMCLREIILGTTLDFYLLFREKIVRKADLVRKNMCEYFIGQCRKYLHKHNISVQDFRANASINILEDRRGSRHFPMKSRQHQKLWFFISFSQAQFTCHFYRKALLSCEQGKAHWK